MIQEMFDLGRKGAESPHFVDAGAEYRELPHHVLLEWAWEELDIELRQEGASPNFLHLRNQYSERILNWWKDRLRIFVRAGGKIGQTVDLPIEKVFGPELVTVSVAEAYEDEDTKVLLVDRRTPLEKDEVIIAASHEGVDEYIRPPKIKSQVSSEPDGAYNLVYEVTFSGKGKISRFERVQYLPGSVRKQELIDCSSLATRERWSSEFDTIASQ